MPTLARNPKHNIYEFGLDKVEANFQALTPLTFLERTALAYPNRTSVIYGTRRFTWRETFGRCLQLASALAKLGVKKGDTVATMLPNVPAQYEVHFGVPMAGAVLNTLNTRLDAEAIAFMLQHGEAKVLLTDAEFAPIVSKALNMLGQSRRPFVIDVEDAEFSSHNQSQGRLSDVEYEMFLLSGKDSGNDAATTNPAAAAIIAGAAAAAASASGSAAAQQQQQQQFLWKRPESEWDAIALNYTSGTSGDPKGVVYSHRGVYLNAVGNIVSWGMPSFSVFLWTLPLFHCNGWCFPYTNAAGANVNVLLRKVEVKAIFQAMQQHKVTHYCGAPIVHSSIAQAPEDLRALIKGQRIDAIVGGAAPPAAIIEAMERIGIRLTHVYGLTETYGPASVCVQHAEWTQESISRRAQLNARQGIRYLMQENMLVLNPETMEPVPWDGETVGEICFKGNLVMKGYLKNPKTTDESFAGGWYRTGDLAVVEPDGYTRIRDRSKDIIISGGENISSLEVEDVLYRHPAVLGAAVVAWPDPKWGEVPCAYLEVRTPHDQAGAGAGAASGGDSPPVAPVTEKEIIDFCRREIAHFKCPRVVRFTQLPRTSTGKIQKFILRKRAQEESAAANASPAPIRSSL